MVKKREVGTRHYGITLQLKEVCSFQLFHFAFGIRAVLGGP